jgi:CTP:molybdopterin cytidylyltransferase MocA
MSSAADGHAPDPRAQPVVILGAGHGTRMGGPKVFARIEGVTFLERILMRVREAGCPAILTVDAGFHRRVEALLGSLPPLPLRLVEVDGTLAMLASVQAGLAALDGTAEGAWLWPVDAPLLSAEGWRRARAAAGAAAERILKLRADGRTGHPLWLPRWACAAVAAGSWADGLLGFLAGVPPERIAHLDLPGETLGDFNTPAQLAAAGH